jgi:hypothetical protein
MTPYSSLDSSEPCSSISSSTIAVPRVPSQTDLVCTITHPKGLVMTTPIGLGRLRQSLESRGIIAKFGHDNPEFTDMDMRRPAYLRDPRFYDPRFKEQYLVDRVPGYTRSQVYSEASPVICWTAHDPFLQTGWTVMPNFEEGAHIWIKWCNQEMFKELKDSKRCFVCKASSHKVKECPNLNSKF